MARIKTALLMTVGTGGDKQEKKDSLAHGMLQSIEALNPDFVIFFGSTASKETIESLKKQYTEKYSTELDYKFHCIENVDDFDDYYLGFDNCIQTLKKENYKIVIDHTSGTKTMSMTAAIAAMVYGIKLYVIEGERRDGAIIKGTENIKGQNLYLAYDKLILDKVKELFNTNRFDSGLLLLEDLSGPNINKETYKKLFKTYSFFDKVNYTEALKNYDYKAFIEEFPQLQERLQNNMKALNIINEEEHKLKYYYILATIFNNADRRAQEYKYDDAIARLYRSLELIAQIKLEKDYNLHASDIKTEKLTKLDPAYLSKLEAKKKDGKIKLGLTEDYTLLAKLNDNLGKYYMENEKKILDKIKLRNNSILAHGLNYTTQEEYESFREYVYEFACLLVNNFDNYLLETKFPLF